MTESLLFRGMMTLAAVAAAFSVNAETKAYFFDEIGEVMGVSDNGRYVAVSDVDNKLGYIWDRNNPGELKEITVTTEDTTLPSSMIITGVSVMDLSDEGIAVGTVYYKDGKAKASYYENGEWKPLPLHEFVRNTTEAVAITPDGKVIGGYQFINDPKSETGGRYYPCQWFRQDDGSYALCAYTDIELPAHQGFYIMTQNLDGTILGGELFCGAGGTIPALLVKGELVYFNKLETRPVPFEYKGEIKGYFDEPFIDGYQDGKTGDYFEGAFDNCDANGNFYGCRTRAINVDEEGNGTLIYGACIYNIDTNEWIDNTSVRVYTAGIGQKTLFTGNGSVILDGEEKDLKDAFEFSARQSIAGISKISAAGNILGGMWQEVNMATGEMTYYPFVLELDHELVGVQGVVRGEENVAVVLSAGHIEVANAGDAVIYDLDGRIVAHGTSADVDPGIYVVKAGNTSVKVSVR